MWFAVHCMATTFSQHLQAIELLKPRLVKNGTLPLLTPVLTRRRMKASAGIGIGAKVPNLLLFNPKPQPLTLSVISSRLVATCKGWSNVDPSFLRCWFFQVRAFMFDDVGILFWVGRLVF